jgi:hypothetical protein
MTAFAVADLVTPETTRWRHGSHERHLMAPPSGADTLEVRQKYFRKRRSRSFDTRRSNVIWIVAAAVAVWLCIGGFAVLVFGS